MNAIVLTDVGRLEMRQVPAPEPRAGQVRVRTAACGICATDLEMIDGAPRVRPPAILGHEWAGVVEAVGEGVEASLVGRPCVAENVLADGGEVGFEHPGGYGEFLVTEAANVHALPQMWTCSGAVGFPMAVAALVEPLAVAVRAVRRLGVRERRAALVFGDGPIGLLVLMLLRRAGLEDVVLVGGRPGRLALARELGAAKTVNYHVASHLVAAVRNQGGGTPRPYVVEASGAALAMEAALELAAPEGRILVVGDYGDAQAQFPWSRVLHRELELVGSNASAGAWPEAVRLATDAALPLGRLVSARFPADRFAEAMALVRSRRDDVVKVVLEWT